MSESRFSNTPPPTSPEKGTRQRMFARERQGLMDVARGPVGRWLAMAALLLSSEGCATYRSQVRTDYAVGNMPVPSGSAEARLPASMYATPEGRRRADRLSPPLPEHSSSSLPETGSMIGARVTLQERTRTERLREAAMGHPELLRSGDQLVIRDQRGNEWLNTEHLETRWWRELQPGTIYHGTDGREYVMLAFQRLSLPSAHDPRSAGERATEPQHFSSRTSAEVTYAPPVEPSSSMRESLGRRLLHRETTYNDIRFLEPQNQAQAEEQAQQRAESRQIFRSVPQIPMQTDPGIAGLQRLVEHDLGDDAQVFYRHEEDVPPRPPIRDGVGDHILGTAAQGHQEWRSPIVFYLVRSRDTGPAPSAESPVPSEGPHLPVAILSDQDS